MHVGREKVKSTEKYFMHNEQGDKQELEVTRVERDLGVMISDDLKLGHQVAEAAARANRVLGMFKKTFKSRGLSCGSPCLPHTFDHTLSLQYKRGHLI